MTDVVPFFNLNKVSTQCMYVTATTYLSKARILNEGCLLHPVGRSVLSSPASRFRFRTFYDF